MITLSEKGGHEIGTVTEEQLQELVDALEEESEEDQDYWIDAATIDMLRDRGVDEELLGLLTGAVGDRDGLEIEWTEE